MVGALDPHRADRETRRSHGRADRRRRGGRPLSPSVHRESTSRTARSSHDGTWNSSYYRRDRRDPRRDEAQAEAGPRSGTPPGSSRRTTPATPDEAGARPRDPGDASLSAIASRSQAGTRVGRSVERPASTSACGPAVGDHARRLARRRTRSGTALRGRRQPRRGHAQPVVEAGGRQVATCASRERLDPVLLDGPVAPGECAPGSRPARPRTRRGKRRCGRRPARRSPRSAR